jgi:hypothetical protein
VLRPRSAPILQHAVRCQANWLTSSSFVWRASIFLRKKAKSTWNHLQRDRPVQVGLEFPAYETRRCDILQYFKNDIADDAGFSIAPACAHQFDGRTGVRGSRRTRCACQPIAILSGFCHLVHRSCVYANSTVRYLDTWIARARSVEKRAKVASMALITSNR